MPMSDYGHEKTEEMLVELEKRIARIYSEAAAGMKKTAGEYFARLEQRDKEMLELLQKGDITEEHYKQWRLNQIGRGQRFEALRDDLAERVTKANEVAMAYVNDATPGVYSLNRNYTAYTIERIGGNIGFTLWDESTVKRLIVEEPDLMPNYPEEKTVKRGIDLAYGKKQITASVTSGILQGKSIGDIADDLQSRITDMSRTSALRAARTAMTGAQNAGRQDSYKAAAEMGINVRKRWMATKDGRTRHSHRRLDGEVIAYDEKFSNGLLYPCDPGGDPSEVYNCRCTMRTVEKDGIEAEPRMTRVQNPEYTRALEEEEKERARYERALAAERAEADPEKRKKLREKRLRLQKSTADKERKRKSIQKNVVVKDMTYQEWERWVKQRG